MLFQILNDESGYVVSAELVILVTIVILGLIVGLSSIQQAIVAELNDVSDATGQANQDFMYTGFSTDKPVNSTLSAYTRGAGRMDLQDDGDDDQCDIACDVPVVEAVKR